MEGVVLDHFGVALDELNISSKCIEVAVERCELCGTNRRSYYCKNCVQSWNLVKSSSRLKIISEISDACKPCQNVPYGEKSSKEKLASLKAWHIRKTGILQRFDQVLQKKTLQNEKVEKIHSLRKNVQLLRKAVKYEKGKVDRVKMQVEVLQEMNKNRCSNMETLSKKKQDVAKALPGLITKRDRAQDMKYNLYEHIVDARQQHLHDIKSHIFPIHKTQSKKRVFKTKEEEQVYLLEEAKLTSYIEHKWVIPESDVDHVTIVGPSLPENGDYSNFSLWINKQCGAFVGDLLPHKYPTVEMTGALQLATQCTMATARVLGVVLPFKLHISDFGDKLNHERFCKRVCRLNACILHLALSQSVDVAKLQPLRTLSNLHLLLHWPQRGRAAGPFDSCGRLFEALGFSQAVEPVTGSDSDGEEDNLEWEHITSSVSSPEYDPTSLPTSTDMNRSGLTNLYSSATGTVSSIWRTFWGRSGTPPK